MYKQFFLKSGLLPQIRTISGPLSSKKTGIGPKSGKSDLSGRTDFSPLRRLEEKREKSRFKTNESKMAKRDVKQNFWRDIIYELGP